MYIVTGTVVLDGRVATLAQRRSESSFLVDVRT